jgi:prevent-host-death family protein
MQIVPMRDLKNTVEIERRCAESGEPVFVTKNGYGKLVVMDIDLYERTMRKMYEARLVNESLADIESGANLIDGGEVRKRIAAK